MKSNIYETPELRPLLFIYKSLPSDRHLTKDMLDRFLQPKVIKYYENCLKARRQNKRFFTITDSDLKMIITQTYLNLLKQIERGQKPIIANKIKELFGMVSFNVMTNEIKERGKGVEFIDFGDIDIAGDSMEVLLDKAKEEIYTHELYLKVMGVAQEVLTKIELDCFTFKYYSNYTNNEIRKLLGITNINKVAQILNSAEMKLKVATKHMVS